MTPRYFSSTAVIGRERRACRLVHDAAALDDGGAVGDAEDLLRVLLDQDRREAFLADDALERREQLLDDDRREAFERLVEQDDARVEDQRAADREHLLLAAGELVAEIAPPLGEPREHRVDLAGGPRPRARHGGEVFVDGERLEDVALLRHPADAGMGALVGAQAGDVAPAEPDRAAAIARHADDGVDQRGLAHAVAAEQRERLAFGEASSETCDSTTASP